MSYSGRISTTGNSEAIRLDKNLFKQHPEFRQQAQVRADVIGPGTMLLRVVGEDESTEADESDPMVCAFLSFMEKDIASNPRKIAEVSEEQMRRIADLTSGIDGSDDEGIE